MTRYPPSIRIRTYTHKIDDGPVLRAAVAY